MNRKSLIVVAALTELTLSFAWSAELSKGIEEFEQHRWMASIREFIDVLKKDPHNSQAHDYLALAIQQVEMEKRARIHDRRLEILQTVSTRMENNFQDATGLRQAISETTQSEVDARSERWHAQCQMALAENRLGHLPAANDLVLQVLAEDANNAEAQRLLSDLQSQIHETLDLSVNTPEAERAALEGFYAYGQADYRQAHTAWTKAREALARTLSMEEAGRETAALHFEAYDKVAQAHVDEEDRHQREERLFAEGTKSFEKGGFAEALDRFREVALSNPDHPQLARFLVQSEAAVEKERTSRLSREKREKAAEAFAEGVAALEKTQYPQAKRAFEIVLAQDPSHPQARSYLSVVETEMNRQHDPRAAELHYEAGLVSYASGKFEEAMREWGIATRLDPGNVRAANALTRAQKELAGLREVPG